jgi:hypothetical protein
MNLANGHPLDVHLPLAVDIDVRHTFPVFDSFRNPITPQDTFFLDSNTLRQSLTRLILGICAIYKLPKHQTTL